jgi:hypothetical protein
VFSKLKLGCEPKASPVSSLTTLVFFFFLLSASSSAEKFQGEFNAITTFTTCPKVTELECIYRKPFHALTKKLSKYLKR